MRMLWILICVIIITVLTIYDDDHQKSQLSESTIAMHCADWGSTPSYDDDDMNVDQCNEYDDCNGFDDHNDDCNGFGYHQKSQLSESTIVLTGGQLHPNLVTEYSGIDNGWQVPFLIILMILIILVILIISVIVLIIR